MGTETFLNFWIRFSTAGQAGCKLGKCKAGANLALSICRLLLIIPPRVVWIQRRLARRFWRGLRSDPSHALAEEVSRSWLQWPIDPAFRRLCDTMSMSCRRFAHMAAADALGTMALLSAGLTISCFTNAVAGDVKANVPRGSLAVYNGPNDGQMIKWVGPDSGQLACLVWSRSEKRPLFYGSFQAGCLKFARLLC